MRGVGSQRFGRGGAVATCGLVALMCFFCSVRSADAQSTVTIDVETALRALPARLRADARVFTFGPAGSVHELRPGDNGFACQANYGRAEAISVLCYHESLLPFESRRRELADAEPGLSATERRDRLTDEILRGDLVLPSVAARYYLSAPEGCHDPTSGHLCGDASWYLELVTPWQTGASLGLSEESGAGQPWVMQPGSAMAHVMIRIPISERTARDSRVP